MSEKYILFPNQPDQHEISFKNLRELALQRAFDAWVGQHSLQAEQDFNKLKDGTLSQTEALGIITRALNVNGQPMFVKKED